MKPPITPADLGRMHALQDLAADAQARADRRDPQAAADDDGRAYLAAYAATARSIAARLRSSPGAAP